MKELSSAEKLVLLIERVVRKVVREELKSATSKVPTEKESIVAATRTRRQSTASNVVDRLSNGDPMLKEIFSNTTPFGISDLDEDQEEFDPMSEMVDVFAQAPQREERKPLIEAVKAPAGTDPIVKRMADIMNKDYRKVLNKSKEFDGKSSGFPDSFEDEDYSNYL